MEMWLAQNMLARLEVNGSKAPQTTAPETKV